MIRELATPEATRAAGVELGCALIASDDLAPWLIGLEGELGAGKTTVVAGLLHALGHKGAVRSPTYTFIEPYLLGGRSVVHCDLYRINDPAEIEHLGLRDQMNEGALLLVEWPSRACGALGVFDLRIDLDYAAGGADARRMQVQAATERGGRLLARLAR